MIGPLVFATLSPPSDISTGRTRVASSAGTSIAADPARSCTSIIDLNAIAI
tara:strand:+ start:1052 stop:1204 length:153 start_codon:yes stop_codon:yes gene_type:complete